MNHQFIENKIVGKLQKILVTNQKITAQDDLTTFGLDSMKSVALIAELEEAFNITFDNKELLFENFTNVKKIIERVKGKLLSAL